jgi:formamidopyrimidine-DNA glycosylase
MPELPDVVVYCEALDERVAGQPLLRVRIVHPFVLRTADPPLSSVEHRRVMSVRRLG